MTLDAAEKAGVPVVRGLVWFDLTSPREDGPPEPTGDIDAQTMFGEYSVCVDEAAIDDAGDDWKWCVWTPVESLGHFADLDEAKAAAQADYEQRITSALNPDYVSALDAARAEIERLRALADRLTLEAQAHAQEARTANSSIYEIYQVLSGSTGEPGNWNGAEPARQFVTAAQARIAELEGALTKLESAATKYHRVTEEHFTDTDYDRDGGLAEADAELSVVALPLARATLSPVKEPK